MGHSFDYEWVCSERLSEVSLPCRHQPVSSSSQRVIRFQASRTRQQHPRTTVNGPFVFAASPAVSCRQTEPHRPRLFFPLSRTSTPLNQGCRQPNRHAGRSHSRRNYYVVGQIDGTEFKIGPLTSGFLCLSRLSSQTSMRWFAAAPAPASSLRAELHISSASNRIMISHSLLRF